MTTSAETSEQFFTQVMALRNQAVSLANQGRRTEALEILIKAEKTCRENRRIDALLTILREKAITLSTGGDPDSALQIVEEAEQICYALSEWELLYRTLRDKSVFYALASHPPQAFGEAEDVLIEWLQLARKGQDPANLVDALVAYALNTLHLDEPSQQSMLDEAFDIASKHGLRDQMARIHQVNAVFNKNKTPLPSDVMWKLKQLDAYFPPDLVQKLRQMSKEFEERFPTLLPNQYSNSKPQPVIAQSKVVNQPIVLLSLEHRFEQTEKLVRIWWQQNDYANALHLALIFFQRSRNEFTQSDYERLALLVKTCLEAFPKPEADGAGVIPTNDLELQIGLGLFTTSLGTMANVFIYRHDFAIVKRLAGLAVDLGWLHLGDLNPELDLNLRYLIQSHLELKEYQAVLPHVRHKLKVMERIGTISLHEWVATLNQLAIACRHTGQYTEAEQAYLQAINLHRAYAGKTGELAVVLSNLSTLYVDMGRDAEAQTIEKQAFEARQASVDWNDPQMLASVRDLAEVYQRQGDLSQAANVLKQAFDHSRPLLGEHPDVASLAHNLGDLWTELGNPARANAYFAHALKIQRAAFGNIHKDVASSLMGMAATAIVPEQATSYVHEALEIQRALTGEQSAEYARYLGAWALMKMRENGFRGTRAMLQRVLAVQRATLDARSVDIIETLNSLGLVHHMNGDYANAELFYREVLTLKVDVPGLLDEGKANLLTNLAAVCAAQKKYETALSLQSEALLLYIKKITSVLAGASERQRAQYLSKFREDYDVWFSIAARQLANVSASQALEVVYQYKGIHAEMEITQHTALQAGNNPDLLARFEEIRKLRNEIRTMLMSGPGDIAPMVFEAQLMDLEQKLEGLESELATQVPQLRLSERLLKINTKEIARQLPSGSALIEYVYFNKIDFNYIESREHVIGSGQYLAIVILPGPDIQIHLVELGHADPIDQCVRSLILSMLTPTAQRRSFIESGAASETSPENAVGILLRQRIFDPLAPILDDCKRLYMAPDGELNGLPFEVLPLSSKEYLLDHYTISYLGTSRDVLRFENHAALPPHQPVVISNPAFDLESVETPVAVKPRLPFGWQQKKEGNAPWRFGPLPATQVEGDKIAQLLDVEPWNGNKALKGPLKSYRSPFILHLATHGFFQRKTGPDDASVLAGILSPAAHTWASTKVNFDRPYLRSGLAFAGANTWLAGGTPPEDAEDGLLTADEVVGLNLSATELVVLSACETGLGDIQIREGVFGLRRSFILAGAKTIVMSLWPVPDKQTQELMIDFYHGLLKGWPRVDALREAQLIIKSKYPDPYYWGAFICQGDPSPVPLRGIQT